MDDIQGGMKEKLLEKLLEMFTQMADKEEAPEMGEHDPKAAMLEVDAIGKPSEKKAEMC